jgi:hypothetical protein
LWKLPLRQAVDIARLPLLAEHRYAITRYRVTLRVYDGNTPGTLFHPQPGDSWVDPDEVPGLAMAAPFRRAVERLLEEI